MVQAASSLARCAVNLNVLIQLTRSNDRNNYVGFSTAWSIKDSVFFCLDQRWLRVIFALYLIVALTARLLLEADEPVLS